MQEAYNELWDHKEEHRRAHKDRRIEAARLSHPWPRLARDWRPLPGPWHKRANLMLPHSTGELLSRLRGLRIKAEILKKVTERASQSLPSDSTSSHPSSREQHNNRRRTSLSTRGCYSLWRCVPWKCGCSRCWNWSRRHCGDDRSRSWSCRRKCSWSRRRNAVGPVVANALVPVTQRLDAIEMKLNKTLAFAAAVHNRHQMGGKLLNRPFEVVPFKDGTMPPAALPTLVNIDVIRR
ncbi:hypothetical protein B0H14DRAFT_1309633 [Mycena olivaceomarginata]|nr:hypothetical protein B0H14DRAFT_1309633 [Mycena olivaceomarginata]